MIISSKHDVDSHVYNYIHDSGVQTTVKVSPSGHYRQDNLDRTQPVTQDKRKYSVIISSSVGCPLSCQFCHLTLLNKPHRALSHKEITDNVLEAIHVTRDHEDLSSRYIKLCFMGEGEAILNISNVRIAALDIISGVMERGWAAGLDGVDIATAFPNVGVGKLYEIIAFNHELSVKWPLNPHNYELNVRGEFRSVVRLFYSMHHSNDVDRAKLMPGTAPLSDALRRLGTIANSSVNLVIHYMFIEGVNDSSDQVNELVNLINGLEYAYKIQFRILRYNPPNADTRESPRLKDIVSYLQDDLAVDFIKVQYSAGEAIKGACGMFMDDMVEVTHGKA